MKKNAKRRDTVLTFEALGKSARVDREQGIIYDVAVVTIGEAKSHDKWIDETTLETVVTAAQKFSNGVKVKTSHGGGAMDVAGAVKNLRRDGEKVLGDFHVLESFEDKDKLYEMAETMPDTFGLSLKFDGKDEVIGDKVYARCLPDGLMSIDLAADPAANPNGLFEKPADAPAGSWQSIRGHSVFVEDCDTAKECADKAALCRDDGMKASRFDDGSAKASMSAWKASGYAKQATELANESGQPQDHTDAAACHMIAAEAHDYAHGTKSVLDSDEMSAAYEHRDAAQMHTWTAASHSQAAQGVPSAFDRLQNFLAEENPQAYNGQRQMDAAKKQSSKDAPTMTELETAKSKISELETKVTTLETAKAADAKRVTELEAAQTASAKRVTELEAEVAKRDGIIGKHATELQTAIDAKEADLKRRTELAVAEATGKAGTAGAAKDSDAAKQAAAAAGGANDPAKKLTELHAARKGSTVTEWEKKLPASLTEAAK